MANWETISIDLDLMEPGKFYSVYADKDNATLLIEKNVQDLVNLKVEELEASVQELQTKDNDFSLVVYDNQARIENLENADVRFNILGAIENASIRFYFKDVTQIEIMHQRNTIVAFNIFQEIINTDTEKEYSCITSGVTWKKLEQLIDGNWKRKIVINSNYPITGYAEVL